MSANRHLLSSPKSRELNHYALELDVKSESCIFCSGFLEHRTVLWVIILTASYGPFNVQLVVVKATWLRTNVSDGTVGDARLLVSSLSPLMSQLRVVLGQHSFNATGPNTRTFGVEKYIFPKQFSVFNPTLHDIGKH